MRDIETRQDLELVLGEFYKIAIADETIGIHFVDLDLESHLPVITDFWVKTLFDEPVYFGNPMHVHQVLHEKQELKTDHFERWVEIFKDSVDRLFEGEIAENAKSRAVVIAKSMDLRLNHDDASHIQIRGK